MNATNKGLWPIPPARRAVQSARTQDGFLRAPTRSYRGRYALGACPRSPPRRSRDGHAARLCVRAARMRSDAAPTVERRFTCPRQGRRRLGHPGPPDGVQGRGWRAGLALRSHPARATKPVPTRGRRPVPPSTAAAPPGPLTRSTARLATLFLPVGNPGPDYNKAMRQGANLFTISVVALDARAGKLKWWYQLRANDDHDWDATVVSLFDSGGKKLVATAGKEGILHVVQREDGKLVFKLPVTTVLNHDVPITGEGVRVCPVAGVQWNRRGRPARRPNAYTLKRASTGAPSSGCAPDPKPGEARRPSPTPHDLADGWRTNERELRIRSCLAPDRSHPQLRDRVGLNRSIRTRLTGQLRCRGAQARRSPSCTPSAARCLSRCRSRSSRCDRRVLQWLQFGRRACCLPGLDERFALPGRERNGKERERPLQHRRTHRRRHHHLRAARQAVHRSGYRSQRRVDSAVRQCGHRDLRAVAVTIRPLAILMLSVVLDGSARAGVV